MSVVGLLSRSLTSTLRSGGAAFGGGVSVHVSFGQQTPRVSAHLSDLITFKSVFLEEELEKYK